MFFRLFIKHQKNHGMSGGVKGLNQTEDNLYIFWIFEGVESFVTVAACFFNTLYCKFSYILFVYF